jgi:hypothetical protein
MNGHFTGTLKGLLFWYLKAFDSQAEMDEVSREYEGNKALTSALAENLKWKAPYLAAESTNVFLNYRPELSRGNSLGDGLRALSGHGLDERVGRHGGTLYEGPDGNRLVIRAVRTRAEAESMAAAAGAGTHIFAIHPEKCPRATSNMRPPSLTPQRTTRRSAAVRQFPVAMVSPCKWNVAHRAGGSETFSATYSTMEILPEFSRR